MSPEQNPNAQVSPADSGAEQPTSASPAAMAGAQSATAAATAVAREPESAPPSESQNSVNSAPDGHASAAPEDPAHNESAPQNVASESTSAEQSEAQGEAAEMAEAMDRMLDQFPTAGGVAEGEIFDGHVLAVTDAGVVVDVGGKFEGLVPAQEFLDSGVPIEFGSGQTIEVERLHEQKDGYVLLSHARAHRRRSWERIEKASREHTNLIGKVL